MPSILVRIDTVVPADVDMLVRVVGNGSLPYLIAVMTDFGLEISERLSAGAKITSGNDYRGYHKIDITLRDPIRRFRTVDRSDQVHIFDIPTYGDLKKIASRMGLSEPEDAIPRLAYWFVVAAQCHWMYLPIFIMDHVHEEWHEYKFRPLLDARDLLEF